MRKGREEKDAEGANEIQDERNNICTKKKAGSLSCLYVKHHKALPICFQTHYSVTAIIHCMK